MKKLIINADDFGYSRGVNYGIIDAYKLGILTSATFMTNMPGARHSGPAGSRIARTWDRRTFGADLRKAAFV